MVELLPPLVLGIHKPKLQRQNLISLVAYFLLLLDTNLQEQKIFLLQQNNLLLLIFVFLKNSLLAIDQATLKQDKLEFEIEKLRTYVEDILRDQNDMNEELSRQMTALQMSLDELTSQVDYLNQEPKKQEPLPHIGYQAIWERDHKDEK